MQLLDFVTMGFWDHETSKPLGFETVECWKHATLDHGTLEPCDYATMKLRHYVYLKYLSNAMHEKP